MKKIFKTDSETIEVKELLKEIDQAEEILDNLRLKDPIYKKRQRREKFFIIMIASVSLIFIFCSLYAGFRAGVDTAFDYAERIYNYSVTTGYIIPEE